MVVVVFIIDTGYGRWYSTGIRDVSVKGVGKREHTVIAHGPAQGVVEGVTLT